MKPFFSHGIRMNEIVGGGALDAPRRTGQEPVKHPGEIVVSIGFAEEHEENQPKTAGPPRASAPTEHDRVFMRKPCFFARPLEI